MSGTEKITVRGDGITLDLLLWRKYRRKTPGLVERTLEMNRGLADSGTFLPVGTVVTLPVDAPQQTPARRNFKRLWD